MKKTILAFAFAAVTGLAACTHEQQPAQDSANQNTATEAPSQPAAAPISGEEAVRLKQEAEKDAAAQAKQDSIDAVEKAAEAAAQAKQDSIADVEAVLNKRLNNQINYIGEEASTYLRSIADSLISAEKDSTHYGRSFTQVASRLKKEFSTSVFQVSGGLEVGRDEVGGIAGLGTKVIVRDTSGAMTIFIDGKKQPAPGAE